MLNKAKIEWGLENIHGWINFTIALGVPEVMMWSSMPKLNRQLPHFLRGAAGFFADLG